MKLDLLGPPPHEPRTGTRGENVPTVPSAEPAAVDVTALLERGRTLATPVLRSAVDRLAPPMDTVAAYHFGWIDAAGNPSVGDGGKAVRPALALLSAEAAGASPETGVPGVPMLGTDGCGIGVPGVRPDTGPPGVPMLGTLGH